MSDNERAKHILLDQTCSTCRFCNPPDNMYRNDVLGDVVLKEDDELCDKWTGGRGVYEWPMKPPDNIIYYMKYKFKDEETNENN